MVLHYKLICNLNFCRKVAASVTSTVRATLVTSNLIDGSLCFRANLVQNFDVYAVIKLFRYILCFIISLVNKQNKTILVK